jgi:hypothetical protein
MDLRQEKAYNAYLAALREVWAEADFIDVNEEALAMAGKEDADPETVVFEWEGSKFTLLNMLDDLGGKYEQLEDVAARRALLIELPGLQQAVLMWDIERMGIRERPQFKLAQQIVESTMITPQVLEAIIQEKLEEPTEEELRARFEQDSAQFTKVPSAFIWRISVTAETESEPGTEEYRNAVRQKMMELSQAMAEIKDVTGFEQLARELSEDEFATLGGRVGRVNSFQEEGYYAPVIERMNGQGVVGPLIKDRLIQGYWVEEVFDTSETAFQDVRELVRNNEMEARRMRIGRMAETELREGSGLKIFFDPEKTAAN